MITDNEAGVKLNSEENQQLLFISQDTVDNMVVSQGWWKIGELA